MNADVPVAVPADTVALTVASVAVVVETPVLALGFAEAEEAQESW